jgi:hypothetical protein
MSEPTSRIPVTAMTLREQVCLTLRVPQSGTDWLDDLILKALRVQFQHAQYRGLCQDPLPGEHVTYEPENWIAAALADEPETGDGSTIP